MSRELIAYVLLAVLIAGIGVTIGFARRKAQAQRHRRGSRRRIAVLGQGQKS